MIKTFLINGCRIAVCPITGVKTVVILAGVKAGSWYEKGPSWGQMHLLEHLSLLSTNQFPTPELLEQFKEKYGLTVSGSTGGDSVAYTFKLPGFYLQQSLQLLSQTLFFPQFEADSLHQELKVIAQEYQDKWNSPYTAFHQAVHTNLFGPDHPFTRDGLGQPDYLSTLSPQVLSQTHRQFFQPQNLTLVLAGNITAATAKSMLIPYLEAIDNTHLVNNVKPAIHPVSPTLVLPQAKVDRTTVVFDWFLPGDDVYDLTERLGFNLFRHILDNRLFHAIRQHQGLAYNFGCTLNNWPSFALFEIWGDIDNQAVPAFTNLIQDELAQFLATEIDPLEFKRVRRYLDIRTQMIYDSVGSIAENIYDSLFYHHQVITPEDNIKLAKKINITQTWAILRHHLAWGKRYTSILKPTKKSRS